jgi:hypothetical protein
VRLCGSATATGEMKVTNRTPIAIAVLLVLLVLGNVSSYARDTNETISATAFGTSTQMGKQFPVKIIIYEYSTPEDRQILVDAFQKGQNQGLVNALSKMKSVGRIQIPGTVGYDLSFIRLIPTPTGRKIRFVAQRPITFGEAWTDSRSQAYNLTAGELDLNDADKSKSSGALYPAAQFTINKEGELQLDLNRNPWRLSGIIDWKGEAEAK